MDTLWETDTIDTIDTICAGPGEPDTLVVRHTAITDRHLSLADLGLYMRCLWLCDVRGEHGDVDWFLRELGMPSEATQAGLRRLVRAGYLRVPSPEGIEARRSLRQAEAVREALDRAGGLLSDYEEAVITRFVRLTEESAERAVRTAALFAQYADDEGHSAAGGTVAPASPAFAF